MGEIRLGGYQGPNSVHTRGMRLLQGNLTERLGARVALDENIVGRGHKASDLLEMVEAGALEMCYFASSYLVPWVASLGVFDQHFKVPDRPTAYAMLDGPLGQRFADDIAANTGYRALGFWDNGFRHISSKAGRPIRKPGDCAGLKIRTLANENHQRVVRALGFEPHVIDVRDLPQAVATGHVDAQENPLTNTYNFGLHRTHRHVTLTRHLFGVALFLVNRHWFDACEPAEQAAIREAVAAATQAQRQFAKDDDETCAAALTEDGVELIEIDVETRAAFSGAVDAAVTKTRAQYPADLVDLFDAALGSDA